MRAVSPEMPFTLCVSTRGDTVEDGFHGAFGVVYLALGVLGFAAPGVVAAVIGHPLVDSGELTPDNVFHIVVGAVFLLAGLTGPRTIPAGRAA